MGLKFKLSKKQYEALDDEMKDNYAVTQDGKSYELDVEGLPEPEDAGAIKRARDREKELRESAEEERDEATAELKKLKEGQSTGEKDVAKVTERYERKLTKVNEEANARVQKMRDRIADGLKNTTALTLANEVSTAPKLFVEHATKRMVVEFDDDDNPTLKFTAADGKTSDSMKVEDLKKELVASKDLAAIIKATNARGSGAPPAGHDPLKTGGAGVDEKPTDLAKADKVTLTEAIRAKVTAKHAAEGTTTP